MPRWMKPSEALPCGVIGTRIIIIANIRDMQAAATNRKHRHVLVLQLLHAKGWTSCDKWYRGYTLADAEYWAYETSVIAFAEAIELPDTAPPGHASKHDPLGDIFSVDTRS